jgi:xylan 1,4-beta-xylosidase
VIRMIIKVCPWLFLLAISASAQNTSTTWTADNGNGTYTNPLFYDEFSDPDILRVGDDYYLTGTTMHSMPGLPIFHSKDLVNWKMIGYVFDRLDLGPEFRLEDDKSIYGQGIWAPSFRYHNGTYYIISNVNKKGTQVYTATNPAGPWTHQQMNAKIHDASLLFDDDGKIYAVTGYRSIKLMELTKDLLNIVPGTEREIITQEAGMGEGLHIYKIKGMYYMLSAWYDGEMRMPAARAKNIYGPYEVNLAVSRDEDFGLHQGYRVPNPSSPMSAITPPNYKPNGRMSLHQGGMVETATGEWWGFTMMDHNSVGRTTSLSPITWKDGWPYFGLPKNLTRTPRTWVKPNTGFTDPITAPYKRSDDFSGETLSPIWQWSHVPDNSKWSLKERSGFLRLHSLPSPNFWQAKNSLTQRSIGPRSTPTIIIESAGLKTGDVAGLSVFGKPYAWLGVERSDKGLTVAYYDMTTNKTERIPTTASRFWFRAECDFLTEKTHFSYSIDGKKFEPIGSEFTMVFNLATFQGMRYALFNYNTLGKAGGYADFDSVDIFEPNPKGLMRPIPFQQDIALKSHKRDSQLNVDGKNVFKVEDQGLGRVALRAGKKYVSVKNETKVTLKSGRVTPNETFQWMETLTGELMLMSLHTQKFLRIDPATGKILADAPGAISDNSDGVRFDWVLIN